MGIYCQICTQFINPKHIGTEAVKCSYCNIWCHIKCTLISDEEAKQFVNDDRKRSSEKWYCSVLCKVGKKPLVLDSDLTTQLKISDTTNATINDMLDTKFNLFKKDIHLLINTIDVKLNDFLIKINVLEEENQKLRHIINQNNEGREYDMNILSEEIMEREKRSANIILFNVPESNSNDNLQVKKIINSIDNSVTEPKNMFRLGKQQGTKPRPIKLLFSNKKEVYLLLKNSSKLKSIQEFKNVFIKSDRTPMQVDFENKVREELAKKKEAGVKNIRIKYIRGIPKIVSTISRQDHTEN